MSAAPRYWLRSGEEWRHPWDDYRVLRDEDPVHRVDDPDRGTYWVLSRFADVFDAAREVEYEIRNDLFSHLQRQPQSFYFHWRTGDLMSRCVNDLNSVRMLLGPALLSAMETDD